MLTDIVSAITGNTLPNSSKGQTMPATQFLDEVKNSPIDANDILTDEQLGRGGLVKIEAFVRTKTSACAMRKAKQRETQKAEGIHTITITIPTEAKEQMKAIAAEITSGKSLVEAMQSVTSHGQITNSIWDGKKVFTIRDQTREQIIGERVLALTGWRMMIAKAIGIL